MRKDRTFDMLKEHLEEDANRVEYLAGLIRGGIDAEKTVEALRDSAFDELRADPELFWGIRSGYLNIYYRGGSIARCYGSNSQSNSAENLVFSFDTNYYPKAERKGLMKALSSTEWLDLYRKGKLKELVGSHQEHNKKYERVVQQELILQNNSNLESSYYCFDMEYSFKQPIKAASKYGRFDILAVSRKLIDGKHRMLLIELKYGTGAYSSSVRRSPDSDSPRKPLLFDPHFNAGSGIVGHLCDYVRYLHDAKNTLRRLKYEACCITNRHRELGLKGVPLLRSDVLAEWPEICILTVVGNVNIDEAQRKMARYLFKNEPHASTRTAEQILEQYGLRIKERPYGIKLKASEHLARDTRIKLLFLDQNLKTLDVNDIHHMGNYFVGLLPS